ncbi:MAG TPA: hypothetical protein VNS79_10375 [Sphingobium sp.]|nr:hypothetical protein [Sphingobium sp.]
MAIIIVTGYDAGSSCFAFSTLKAAGLSEAKHVHDGKLSANLLTQKMCEAYNVNGKKHSGYSQISPGKVWDSLSAEIVLENSKLEIWGWVETDSVYVLDYWRDLDGQCNHILVYSSPEQVLAKLLDSGSIDPGADRAALSKWQAYNEELLRFYKASPGRAILVNAERIIKAPVDLIAACQERFGLDFQRLKEPLGDGGRVSAMALWSASLMMPSFPEAAALFDELQGLADLSRGEPVSPRHLAQDAWSIMKALEKGNASLRQEVAAVAAELRETSFNAADRAEMKKDNELLLLQLHQVQEDLEYYFGEYRNLRAAQEGGASGLLVASASPLGKNVLAATRAAGSIIIDMRHVISGKNWYGPEGDGRWSGPETHSTLQVPFLGSGRYRLDVDIVGAMSKNIVRGMSVSVNGRSVSLFHRWLGQKSGALAFMKRVYLNYYKKRPLYPIRISGIIDVEQNVGGSSQIDFHFPDAISPVDQGGQDDRSLTVRLSQVIITPL